MYLASSQSVLEEIYALKDNWDSYGGIPVLDNVIQQTTELMCLVAKEFNDILYAIAPVPDGGLFLEWRAGIPLWHTKLQVRVSPNGQLAYLRIRTIDGKREVEECSNVSVKDIQAELDCLKQAGD